MGEGIFFRMLLKCEFYKNIHILARGPVWQKKKKKALRRLGTCFSLGKAFQM